MHTRLIRLILILILLGLFLTPTLALAQEEEEPSSGGAAVIIEQPDGELALIVAWVVSLLSALAVYAASVSEAFERLIKPFYDWIDGRIFNGQVPSEVRTLIIVAGILISAYIAGVESGVNIFEDNPLVDNLNQNLRDIITAGVFAAATFIYHDVGKWLSRTPQGEELSVTFEDEVRELRDRAL